MNPDLPEHPLKERVHHVIFGTDTRSGRLFDIVLLWLIGLSVGAVVLESMAPIRARFGTWLLGLEWAFTIIFTIEYLVRVWCTRNRRRYIFSFFGIIDLLACLPTYLALFLTGSHYLLVIRVFRVLRVFRILKMARHLQEGRVISNALKNSRPKITVFLFGILSLAVTMGTVMYMIEGEANGFSSIPVGIYWAIVTLTTVGYGDITPVTTLGKMFSALIMVMGYAIIAVPTGVVTVELMRENTRSEAGRKRRPCPECGEALHPDNASYCHQCGSQLDA